MKNTIAIVNFAFLSLVACGGIQHNAKDSSTACMYNDADCFDRLDEKPRYSHGRLQNGKHYERHDEKTFVEENNQSQHTHNPVSCRVIRDTISCDDGMTCKVVNGSLQMDR